MLVAAAGHLLDRRDRAAVDLRDVAHADRLHEALFQHRHLHYSVPDVDLGGAVGEVSHMLSERARMLLHDAGHTGRQFFGTTAVFVPKTPSKQPERVGPDRESLSHYA